MRWPDGAVCPHCGSIETYKITSKPGSKTRKGLYKCKDCRKQFTVTVGSIFEASHIKLDKWLIAIYLMCSSKMGMSAHQLHRMLGITYKSAWFMCHRIRYAMDQSPLAEKLNGIVEADETYGGGKGHGKRGRGAEKKTPVFSLVDRGGRVSSTVVMNVTGKNLHEIMREKVDKNAIINTDEFRAYWGVCKDFSRHDVVNHGRKEYVRGDTNTAEAFFSLLKRGINGTFHHVSEEHLHRYCAEFDFRYNARKIDDGERTELAIKGFEGKRLMYHGNRMKLEKAKYFLS